VLTRTANFRADVNTALGSVIQRSSIAISGRCLRRLRLKHRLTPWPGGDQMARAVRNLPAMNSRQNHSAARAPALVADQNAAARQAVFPSIPMLGSAAVLCAAGWRCGGDSPGCSWSILQLTLPPPNKSDG